jgi:DNA-directed RNA polymerase subunit RPC12/RpoP
MNRFLKLALVVVAVVLVGTFVSWRLALAPLFALAIWMWARASLRSFVQHGQTGIAAADEPEPVSPDERTMYWCEECGTEVVLTVRGSGLPPRHCGTRMHERSEVLS